MRWIVESRGGENGHSQRDKLDLRDDMRNRERGSNEWEGPVDLIRRGNLERTVDAARTKRGDQEPQACS